jgi:hypothetical protein
MLDMIDRQPENAQSTIVERSRHFGSLSTMPTQSIRRMRRAFPSFGLTPCHCMFDAKFHPRLTMSSFCVTPRLLWTMLSPPPPDSATICESCMRIK